MIQHPTQERPGLKAGREVLSPSFVGTLPLLLEDAALTRRLPPALDAAIASARETLMAARDDWSRAGAVPGSVLDVASSSLKLMATAISHYADDLGQEGLEHYARAVADLLFEVTADDGVDPALQTSLATLRERVLKSFDRSLLAVRFLPRLAQHIGFGSRFIAMLNGDAGVTRWTHPKQVDVALDNSSIGNRSALAESPWVFLGFATTPAALARILETWPTPPPAPWPGGLAPFPLAGFAVRTLIERMSGDAASPTPTVALEGLRLLRDHPRTAPMFWAQVDSELAPDAALLDPIETLAAESAGTEAQALLQLLASGRAERWPGAWDVPADIASRAAMRLAMRRAPVDEMVMP